MPGHYTNTSSIIANSNIVAATLRGLIDDLDDAIYDVDTQNVLAMPSGAITPYAGSTEPVGWLFCYGQAISRTSYASLYAVIGTDYGVGDGSSTFNLPDLRGRAPIALDNMGGASADRVTAAAADSLGGNGGTETHTLDTTQIPSHDHPFNVSSGSSTAVPSGTTSIGAPGNANVYNAAAQNTTIRSNSVAVSGGGLSHPNMQPYIALNYIIKT